MVDIYLVAVLDNIAIELRKILGIDENRVITYEDSKEIINSIKKLEIKNYDIKYDVVNSLKLVDNDKFLITIRMNQSLEEQFNYLLFVFCYSLLFDEKLKNKYQLNEYDFSRVEETAQIKEAKYLRDAFLMPKDLFLREALLNSSDDFFYIDDLQKNLKIKMYLKEV